MKQDNQSKDIMIGPVAMVLPWYPCRASWRCCYAAGQASTPTAPVTRAALRKLTGVSFTTKFLTQPVYDLLVARGFGSRETRKEKQIQDVKDFRPKRHRVCKQT